MTRSRIVWFYMSLLFIPCLTFDSAHILAEDESNDLSPVVVELFTSEGCSSCPPADKLLDKLRADDVLVLSFHVDYWNHLGWRDPFSSPEFTQRQSQYAILFKLDQVYTPQMVVGGETEFVGSDRKAATAAISEAKRNLVTRSLKLEAKMNSGRLQANYSVGVPTENTRLNLAVVQKSDISHATAGENAGTKLPHVNIVRSLKTIEVNSSNPGSVELEVPDGIKHDELFVVGYLQNISTGKIGAAVTQPIR